MNNIKRNILIYLDSYPMVVSLSPEQRGWVLTALMVYGDRLAREEEAELEEVLDQFPQLTSEGRLVCGFMAGNILRDTQKWLSRQQSRQQYKAGGPRPASAPPVSEAEKNRKAREDMERMRKLMEQMKAEP